MRGALTRSHDLDPSRGNLESYGDWRWDVYAAVLTAWQVLFGLPSFSEQKDPHTKLRQVLWQKLQEVAAADPWLQPGS